MIKVAVGNHTGIPGSNRRGEDRTCPQQWKEMGSKGDGKAGSREDARIPGDSSTIGRRHPVSNALLSTLGGTVVTEEVPLTRTSITLELYNGEALFSAGNWRK